MNSENLKIQFTLDWNPFKTNSELFEVIASIVWNEFHGEALDMDYTGGKFSFIFKKGRWSDSRYFNKETFRKECGKVNIRTTYGIG